MPNVTPEQVSDLQENMDLTFTDFERTVNKGIEALNLARLVGFSDEVIDLMVTTDELGLHLGGFYNLLNDVSGFSDTPADLKKRCDSTAAATLNLMENLSRAMTETERDLGFIMIPLDVSDDSADMLSALFGSEGDQEAI